MKKTLSMILCVCLLFSLTACGKLSDLFADPDYRQGMIQLELGNFTKAYDLLKSSSDPRAAEELEQFVFVPIHVAVKTSDGQDTVTTYTYDNWGNLTEEKKTGRYSWSTTVDQLETYTYDRKNLLSHTYKNRDYSYSETYTYDENDSRLSYTYLEDEQPSNGHTCTYDDRGNLLTKTYWDASDPTFRRVFTYVYDEQDRILTYSASTSANEPTVYTYTYAEDGSYQYTYVSAVLEETHTACYDKDDRLLSITEMALDGTIKQQEEYRYDEWGNEIYRRYQYYDSLDTVTTHTYNEQGKLILSETITDGEVTASTACTYNAAGQLLTQEGFRGSTSWSRIAYTYDEQGNQLAKQEQGEWGWQNEAYSYDEAGNCIKTEQKTNSSSTTETYAYDAWGNVTDYTCHEIRPNVSESLSQASIQWTLRYYPDEVPEAVSFAIDEVQFQ